ncbi:MAG: hypothetical protein ACK5HY_11885, partial [Parahaliea sp.]
MKPLARLRERYRVPTPPLRVERRFELAVLVLSVLLLLQLAWFALGVLRSPSPEPVYPAEGSLADSLVQARGVVSARQSAEVRARPLFWESRRPLALTVAEEDRPPQDSAEVGDKGVQGVKLLGTFGSGELAGLIVTVDGQQQRVHVGEQVKGWEVEQVEPDGGVLVSAGRRERLHLERSQRVVALPPPEPEA